MKLRGLEVFILLAAVIYGCTPANEDSPLPEAVFVKYYGNQNTHELYDIVQVNNGEFILFGTRKIDGDTTGSNFYLVRTDPAGNLLEDALIDINNTEDIAAKIKVIDGGYLIVGHIADLNNALIPQAKRLFWAALDENFNITDSLTISAKYLNTDADESSDEVIGTDILITQNDSIVVLGVSDVRASNELTKPDNLQKQILVVKSDRSGNIGWERTTGYSNSDENAIAIYEDLDGGLTIVGSASNVVSMDSHGGVNVLVMNFNSLMTSQINAPRFGITVGTELNYDEEPLGAYRKSPNAGHIVITGQSSFGTNSYPFVMTVTETGTLISADTLTPNFIGNARGTAVTKTNTNEYVVVGTAVNWSPKNAGGEVTKGNEIMFLRADQFSVTESEFSKNYGTQSGNDEAKAVLSLSDGSIVVGGTVDFGSGVTLFTLMKMNDQGELKE